MKPAQQNKKGGKQAVAKCPNCHRETINCSRSAARSRGRRSPKNSGSGALKVWMQTVATSSHRGSSNGSGRPGGPAACVTRVKVTGSPAPAASCPSASWRACRPLTRRLKRLIVPQPPRTPPSPPLLSHTNPLLTPRLSRRPSVSGTGRRHAEGGRPIIRQQNRAALPPGESDTQE